MLEITEETFEQEVLQHKGLVVLDFWATWCGPCLVVGRLLEEIEKSDVPVKIVKVNVDNEIVLSHKFAVTSIPTLVFFKDGKKVHQHIGTPRKGLTGLTKMIQDLL